MIITGKINIGGMTFNSMDEMKEYAHKHHPYWYVETCGTVIEKDGKIIIDGVTMGDSTENECIRLGVFIEGNVEKVETENSSVKIEGNAQHVRTYNGTVHCGDVTGDVETHNGTIRCGNVGGSAKTHNGNIYKN